MKKKVIITGTTGMVGWEALKACLESKEIGTVTSLVRRASGVNHAKLTELIVWDFMNLADLEAHFRNVDLVLYCLAVSAGTVSKEEYRKITVDYLKAFVEMLKNQSPDATFCLFSAAGADRSEKSRMMWARVKGEAENVVLDAGFPQTYAFRPGYIYPIVKRKEPNIALKITRGLYPVLKAIYPNGVITSEYLGRAMLSIGLNGGDQAVFENKDIRKIEL
jgi:uncharacterized protein YbjT (DUF2867 family)